MLLKVWCEPFTQSCRGERKDARVRPDEVPGALEYFKKILGHDVTAIHLNGKMISRIGYAFPDEVEIIEDEGVMSWEIRAVVDGTAPSPDAPDSPQGKKDAGDTPLTLPPHPPINETRIQKAKITPYYFKW